MPCSAISSIGNSELMPSSAMRAPPTPKKRTAPPVAADERLHQPGAERVARLLAGDEEDLERRGPPRGRAVMAPAARRRRPRRG